MFSRWPPRRSLATVRVNWRSRASTIMWPTIERIRARATGMTTRGARCGSSHRRGAVGRVERVERGGQVGGEFGQRRHAARSSSIPITQSTNPTVKSRPFDRRGWRPAAAPRDAAFAQASPGLVASGSRAPLHCCPGRPARRRSRGVGPEFGVSGAMLLVHRWTRGFDIVHLSEFRRHSSSDCPTAADWVRWRKRLAWPLVRSSTHSTRR